MQFWGLSLTWFDRKLLHRCDVSVIARHVGFCNVALGKKCWDNEMVKMKFFENCYLVGFFDFGVTILVSKKDLDIAWRQKYQNIFVTQRPWHGGAGTRQKWNGGFSTRSSFVIFTTFSPNWNYFPILRTRNSTKVLHLWKKCVCNELHNIVDGKSSNCDLSTVEAGGDCPGFNFTPVCEGTCKDFYFLF